jgi:hypothetical protein
MENMLFLLVAIKIIDIFSFLTEKNEVGLLNLINKNI